MLPDHKQQARPDGISQQLDISLTANLIRTPSVCARLSRLSLDHVQFFHFELINSIRSRGQAAPRETSDNIAREGRFYVTPFALLAGALGPLGGDRWAAESGLPWVMDLVFRDAECRVC